MERNPIRARLTRLPWRYPWSSAAAHCGEDEHIEVLERGVWRRRYPPAQWRRIVQQADDETLTRRLRSCTFKGRPLGGDRFIAKLESRLNRRLRTPKMGRPTGRSTRRQRSRTQ